jgi:hypothetical protein
LENPKNPKAFKEAILIPIKHKYITPTFLDWHGHFNKKWLG